MKTMLYFKSGLMSTILILTTTFVFAQNYETSKTVNKVKAVQAGITLDVSNHSGDIKFTLSDNDMVSIKTEVHVSAKTEDDAAKLLKAVENFEFELQGNSLVIDTRFYTNMNSINNKVKNLTLLNGDKISLKDFTINHEISMPASANLRLENKYSNVSLPSLRSETKLNLYSCKLDADDFNSDLEVEAKYSKIYASHLNGAVNLDLYDTDLEFKKAGNMSINSKYSSVEGEKAETLELVSYDDKFHITEFANLKLEAKYSDLVSDAVNDQVKLDLYDCNVSISSAKFLSFSGKYSELKLGDVKTLEIGESYDNDLYLKKTQTTTIGESKYSSYQLSSASKFEIAGYDDDVIIDRLNEDFAGIAFDCKYGKLKISSGSVPYKVDLIMKYGKTNFPDTFKPTTYIDKNSELEIKGGATGETIYIRGYDNQIEIR